MRCGDVCMWVLKIQAWWRSPEAASVGFSCVFLCPVSDIADVGIVTGTGDVVPGLNFTCGLDIW